MEIKTKFSIGDKVFRIDDCRVVNTEITGLFHCNIEVVTNPKHKDPEKARRIYTNYRIGTGEIIEEKLRMIISERLQPKSPAVIRWGFFLPVLYGRTNLLL